MISTRTSRTRSGQTIIVALLIMGVLLALGFVFAGLVSRNIVQTGRSFERGTAGDLADSGIRFMHSQLVNSELGGDWVPEPTFPSVNGLGITRDPDALYLRPGTGLRLRLPNGALSNVIDRGGPDGLGPFSRILFDKGRSLIRNLYLPSDFALFGTPQGALRQPGKARYYLRLEAVGRAGRVDPNDPTTLLANGVQVAGFANDAAFNDALNLMKSIDSRNVDQKKLMAFASLGLIEHSLFVTNKYKVSRAAELGSPTAAATGPETDGLGITTEGQRVVVPSIYGGQLFDAAGTQVTRGTGSIYSNADVVFHGVTQTYLNSGIGDSISVAGTIRAANSSSLVQILAVDPQNPNIVTPINLSGAQLNSTSTGFLTEKGLLRDGNQEIDGDGYPRSVSRKEPPSFLSLDPATGANRYITATRDSGVIVNNRNTGRYGYGIGVYVDAQDRANTANENEREAAGAAKSLPDDWLKPNNPGSVAWKGPYYIPIGTYMVLQPDGFVLIRDSRAANPDQRFWRHLDGSLTATSRIRYRLRTVALPGGTFETYSLNSIVNPTLVDLPAAGLTDATFINNGQPFNGLVVCQGDLRIRGVIPTDQQLTVVSMGSIYVEGSITKGIVRENSSTLTGPSRSMLMLMAQDYVALNTTMFFGPSVGETVQPKNTDPMPNTPNPVELDFTQGRLSLQTEFILNPDNAAGQPLGNPQTWTPFALSYLSDTYAGGTATNSPWMLLQHAADDNGPAAIRVGVTGMTYADPTATPTSYYLFHNVDPNQGTVVGNYNLDVWNLFGTPSSAIYGLTRPARSAYPRFETISARLTDGTLGYAGRKIGPSAGSAVGDFALGVQDPTRFDVELESGLGTIATKNYALSRFGMNPHDVRVEAGIFAENGSFFVIPGPAFNMNSEDTRTKFNQDVANVGLTTAQQIRFDDFGVMPATPFYNEPLNCRVSLIGSISENMPVPISQQAEWQRKWGWMPRTIGATGLYAPHQHIPQNWGTITGNTPTQFYVPNLILSYDPSLALGSADGATPIRTTPDGRWILPPMPRLPVSPSLAYFGEQNP